MFCRNGVLLVVRNLLRHFDGFDRLCCANRQLSTKQLTYKEWGDPTKVIELTTKELDVDGLPAHHVFVKWLATPVNPADLNQIQGVYPVKPTLPAVGGNEGCAIVEKVGSASVCGLQQGDMVIPARSGLGTWTEYGVYLATQLYRVDGALPRIDAATLQVNPSTAYRMLKDFAKLNPGDLVIQNGANSAVGRYVIQICKLRNLRSINVVRNRETIDELKKDLADLGADEVYTEEEFASASRSLKDVKLGLNCVGGRSGLMVARALSPGGFLVTYGGMSKQPIQVPTGSLIFSDIHVRGYWMARWYEMEKNKEERTRMYNQLYEWIKQGKLHGPKVKTRKLEDFNDALAAAFSGAKQVFVL